MPRGKGIAKYVVLTCGNGKWGWKASGEFISLSTLARIKFEVWVRADSKLDVEDVRRYAEMRAAEWRASADNNLPRGQVWDIQMSLYTPCLWFKGE